MPIVGKIKRSNSRRRMRRPLNSLAFVPSIVTLGNLICGFAAIHFATRAVAGSPALDSKLPGTLLELMLPSFLSIGAGLVLLGMVFDCFDGLLARMTRSTTDFGGQLDSLADVVTFGVAPAALMISFMTIQLATEEIYPSPISDHFLGRLSWVSAAVYVAFTAVRLARYNVEHARVDFDPRMFRGLPSPGAAAVVVCILLFQDHEVGIPLRPILVYVMPLVAFACAFLMVSRIQYKRFHRTYLLSKRPFGQFVVFILIFAVFLLHKAPTMLVLVLWYAVSGPVGAIIEAVRRRRKAEPESTAPSSKDRQTA